VDTSAAGRARAARLRAERGSIASGGGRYRGIRARTGVNNDSLKQPDPAIRHDDVDCDNWMGSLQWFFDRTGIDPFDIPDPNCHGL